MTRLPLLLLALACALMPPPAAASPSCAVPDDVLFDDPALPLVAARLKAKQPITIVAIGGASTAGTAAADPGRDAYPQRLQQVLRRRHPGAAITVLNKGVARQTTAAMVDRFDRDVYPLAPTLVIWETGTVDAVRGVDVDEFANALADGLAALREHKLDVMLMNMQYSRSTASVINFEPYLEAMAHRADVDDIYLFRRFEAMKYWSENGVFEFAEVPAAQRSKLAAAVYDCLAERLADAIEHAAR